MKTRIVISVLLFTSFCSSDVFSQDKMMVLSYNVLNGLRDSTHQEHYLKWVKEVDPDIVAYQEMNNFTQKRIQQFAARYGHPYAVISKSEGYPVALSSKYPIVNVQKVIDNMWHGYLYANINHTHVFVVHLSPASYKKRAEEIRLVLAHAATLPKTDRILIMGDFNAFSRRDAGHYGENLLNDMRAREKKFNQQNLNNDTLDYSVMDQLTSAAYVDTYWLLNHQFQHSLPTKAFATRAIRRIDYIWANDVAATDIKRSGILYDKDTEEISDHYPVYIEIDVD